MNTWIVVAFNTNSYPKHRAIEVEANDIYTAICVSGFPQSEIVSVWYADTARHVHMDRGLAYWL